MPAPARLSRPGSPALTLVRRGLRRRRRDTTVGTVFVVTHQLTELLVPVLIGVVIDRAIATGDGQALLRWLGVLGLLFLALAGAGYLGYQRVRAAVERIAADVRAELAARLLAPAGTTGVPADGELLSLATSDARRVGLAAELVAIGASSLAALAVGALLLLRTSVPLGLVVLGGLPVVVLVVRVLSRPLEQRSAAEQEAVAAATGVATDLLTGLRVLRGLGAERAAAQRYRAASRRALQGRVRAAALLGTTEGVLLGVSGVFLALVAWLGTRLALSGELSVGELVAAVGLAQFLVGPLSRLAYAVGQLAVVTASARRVGALLAAPPEVDDAGVETPPAGAGAVALRGVVAGPLRLDLDLPAGSWTGVVADDADARLLVDLLARRRDPDAGEVRLDGVPLPRLALPALRAAVLVADHDAVLFGGRLQEDLAGSGALPRPEVLAATAADEVVQTLPEGLDAQVGEAGRTLSGGQRQRLALARAVAVDPPVLVLHDPTTAVDSATEARIAQGLRAVRGRRTTVLLTDSPALLRACDAVVVLRAGAVVAAGTHADLLGDDAYRRAVLA